MKKTIFAFAATLILFATVSCHKDKNDDPATIQGKWFIKTQTLQSYENDELKGTVSIPASGNEYFEFLSDGTLKTEDEDGNVYTGTYTYIPDTKKLTTIEDGDSYEYDITKLTSTELTIHDEEIETDGDITYKDIFEIDFHK